MTNGEAVNWLINISADIGKVEHCDLWHYEQALSEIREMLEYEESEPKWIPCSERMPEYMETVLTWDGGAFVIEKRIPFVRDDDGEPLEGDWWVSDDYDECESEYYPNLRDGAAIAWMPLPPCYKEGQE